MITYRKQFYSKYYESHLERGAGAETISDIERQFPFWRKNVEPHLPVDKNAKIIDLGCGIGSLVWWLQKEGYLHAQGIDINENLVSKACSLGIQKIFCKDIEKALVESSNCFDVVIMRDVIEHFTKDEILNILSLVNTSLKPGGKIILQTINAQSPFFGRIRYGDFTHETAFTENSIIQLFEASGFNKSKALPVFLPVTGVRTLIRASLWKMIENAQRLVLYAEWGSGAGILTQNMIVAGTKAKNDQ